MIKSVQYIEQMRKHRKGPMFSTWCSDLSLSFDAQFDTILSEGSVQALASGLGGGAGGRGGAGRAATQSADGTCEARLSIINQVITRGGRSSSEPRIPTHNNIISYWLAPLTVNPSIRLLSSEYLRAVLKVVRFRIYLLSSKLFHSKGRE